MSMRIASVRIKTKWHKYITSCYLPMRVVVVYNFEEVNLFNIVEWIIMDAFLYYLPIMFLFMSAWMFYVGGIVVVKRQPYIFKTFHIVLFVILSFFPAIVMPLVHFFGSFSRIGPTGCMLLISPLIMVVVLLYLRAVMKGYLLLGITKDSFRVPLLQSLKNMNLDYEETIYGIKISPDDVLIQCNIQAQVGMAQLFCDKNNSDLLGKIVSNMRDIYNADKVETKYYSSIFYLILGSFCLLSFLLMILRVA